MNTNIGVIGQGFVGTAVREGLSDQYNVITFDKDASNPHCGISAEDVIVNTDVSFLCVPTPMKKDGSCDVSIVAEALDEINRLCIFHGKEHYIVVLKSTIPPGTTEMFQMKHPFLSLVFNPEFLTEANSIQDFKTQSRIILGGYDDDGAITVVGHLFRKSFPDAVIVRTTSQIAEMVKYVTNTFLAMKVSFANEMSQICNALDINYSKVIEYATLDTRLGKSHWAVPGPDGDFGYGGHCFPKDVAGLGYVASKAGVEPVMLYATIAKNDEVREDRNWERQIGRAVSAN